MYHFFLQIHPNSSQVVFVSWRCFQTPCRYYYPKIGLYRTVKCENISCPLHLCCIMFLHNNQEEGQKKPWFCFVESTFFLILGPFGVRGVVQSVERKYNWFMKIFAQFQHFKVSWHETCWLYLFLIMKSLLFHIVRYANLFA